MLQVVTGPRGVTCRGAIASLGKVLGQQQPGASAAPHSLCGTLRVKSSEGICVARKEEEEIMNPVLRPGGCTPLPAPPTPGAVWGWAGPPACGAPWGVHPRGAQGQPGEEEEE